ncbi:hypothetical protein NESM_000554500 [Novymonas esmeraldas]|uniref:Uncharacterized protein n=1 Tax=Novymonas esmeraldas TaxID=1808958 RepID=A0AAW0EQ87_9TRYP
MLFLYPTAQYPRRALEYVFKSLYMVANLIHMVSLVVLISDFYTRLSNSMPYYYSNSDLVISDTIRLVMDNCVYNGSIHLGNVRGTVAVSAGNIGYGLMTTAQYVTSLFVLEFLLLVNNVIVAFNYSKGNRHLRMFGVHIPFYHISVMMTQVYSIAIVVCVWAFDDNRQLFQRALQYCAEEKRRTNNDLLLHSEFDGYTIFSTAVYWPFAATCVAELIYLAAAVVLCYFSYDRATILLSEADAPWESRGVMCGTYKPLLKLHTAQRNAIIEDARNALKEGQKVRIVRSYQLITEEDFEALVQAMREQVARALKEKQFEQLKKTFGDNEAQLDNMGFAWRENLMAAPPDEELDADRAGDALGSGVDPGPTDHFFNVPFEDYFTDNEGNAVAHDRVGGGGGRRGGNGADAVYRDEPLSMQYDDDGFYNEADNGVLFDPADDGGTAMDAWSPQEGEYMMDGGDGGGDGEVYDPPSMQQRPRRVSHTHHRRHHRRKRGSADAREKDDGDDYRVEPDPRTPSQLRRHRSSHGDHDTTHVGGGDTRAAPAAYYDANEDLVFGTNDVLGGGSGGRRASAAAPGRSSRLEGASSNYPPNARGTRQRRQSRGRQAALEQEDDVADELSDDFGYGAR